MFFFVYYITGFRDWMSRLVSVIVSGCCFIINVVYSASSCCRISGSFAILQWAEAKQYSIHYYCTLWYNIHSCQLDSYVEKRHYWGRVGHLNNTFIHRRIWVESSYQQSNGCTIVHSPYRKWIWFWSSSSWEEKSNKFHPFF